MKELKKNAQLHLEQLIDISKARKWFASLMEDRPKTPDEENLLTEITFQTDLLIVEYHKKHTQDEK